MSKPGLIITALLIVRFFQHGCIFHTAYYLDFQEKRGDYINAFFDKLVNWKFAEENFNAVVPSHQEL